MGIDLNDLWPDQCSGEEIFESGGKSVTTDVKATAYFRDLPRHLINHINQADVVLGCVAWLTHDEILDAMAGARCSLVVQKEDFLRPDMNAAGDRWKARLRDKYSHIGGLGRPMVAPDLSYCSDPALDGVRCVGNHNSSRLPAFPRMHNKFVVFAKCRIDDNSEYSITPYATWTGSFNFTKNGGASLENALYVESQDIAQAYFQEYRHILALSEPLDWESEWVAPQWRIGS